MRREVERVASLVEGNFGKVIERVGDTMTIEIPSDITLPWAGEYLPIYTGMRSGLAERRVVGISGAYVVCPGDMVTMSFARFEIDLRRRPNDSAKAAPSAADITRPVKPAAA
jgi:hypothetical protein